MDEVTLTDLSKEEIIQLYEELRKECARIKSKSSARKRHLRDMNKKIELYIAMIDASISDAARFKAETELWKNRYFALLEKKDGLD